jgi:DNA polymerase (family 10)
MQFDFTDCHVHTEYSACAEDVSLQRYAEFARTSDLVFAITDHSAHVFYPPGKAWAFWSEDAVPIYEANLEAGRERVERYLRQVRSLQRGGMLVGTELDVLPDGRLVFPEDELKGLDVVLGAVHSLPALRQKRPLTEVVTEYKFQAETLAAVGMEVLAHPFRLILGEGHPVPDGLMAWLVELARDAGFALEINSHKQFPDEDLAMTRLALEAGVTLATGTDAHRWSEFGDFSYHARMLEQAGLSPDQWPDVLWRYQPRAGQAAAGS